MKKRGLILCCMILSSFIFGQTTTCRNNNGHYHLKTVTGLPVDPVHAVVKVTEDDVEITASKNFLIGDVQLEKKEEGMEFKDPVAEHLTVDKKKFSLKTYLKQVRYKEVLTKAHSLYVTLANEDFDASGKSIRGHNSLMFYNLTNLIDTTSDHCPIRTIYQHIEISK